MPADKLGAGRWGSHLGCTCSAAPPPGASTRPAGREKEPGSTCPLLPLQRGPRRGSPLPLQPGRGSLLARSAPSPRTWESPVHTPLSLSSDQMELHSWSLLSTADFFVEEGGRE